MFCEGVPVEQFDALLVLTCIYESRMVKGLEEGHPMTCSLLLLRPFRAVFSAVIDIAVLL